MGKGKDGGKKKIIISVLIFIIILGVVAFEGYRIQKSLNQGDSEVSSEGEQVKNVNVQAPVPDPSISAEQLEILNKTLSSSEMIKALPKNGIIGLKFYDFDGNGERVWRRIILIGKTGIISSGSPDIIMFMHSRYIAELEEKPLCDVVKGAEANGEVWSEGQQSDAKLLMKYSGMLKYRDCLGL